jgi:Fic family protein
MNDELPEPLPAFDSVVREWSSELDRLDVIIAAYRERVAAGRIPANSIDAMRLELTYHSNAIEGCTLSLRETQLVIEGRTPGEGKSLREIYEARNHDLAIRLVERWVAERSSSAFLDERDLLAIHARVLADIEPGSAGRFRADRVLIRGTRFVPPSSAKFGTLVPAALDRTRRTQLHVAIRAAELHCNLVAIHPFVDGNGRTARLAMNHLLLANGYPFASIEVERRGRYLEALEAANAGLATPFAAFIIDSIRASIERMLGVD